MGIETLRAALEQLASGEVPESTDLERLLAECWDDLRGDEGGMAGYKLLGRMEKVEWCPPVLQFCIERHGGTVLGSTRGEVQHWSVDVAQESAALVATGWRQLRRPQPPMRQREVTALAAEIADVVEGGLPDSRVARKTDGRVHVVVSRLPLGDGPGQTMLGRRQRFRQALLEVLQSRGWRSTGRDTFGRDDH